MPDRTKFLMVISAYADSQEEADIIAESILNSAHYVINLEASCYSPGVDIDLDADDEDDLYDGRLQSAIDEIMSRMDRSLEATLSSLMLKREQPVRSNVEIRQDALDGLKRSIMGLGTNFIDKIAEGLKESSPARDTANAVSGEQVTDAFRQGFNQFDEYDPSCECAACREFAAGFPEPLTFEKMEDPNDS